MATSSPHPHLRAPDAPPIVYAHRGGAALRPENTIAAFDHGLGLGADGLELDVHLSRDGVVVVHHDETLERTTNGHGRIADQEADLLAGLDAGYWFQPPGPEPSFPYRGRGCRIPTLGDVLRRYPGIPIIIELKCDSVTLVAKVLDEVHAADALERISIGSFYGAALRHARTIEPRLRTGSSPGETRVALYKSYVGWPLGPTAFHEFQVPEAAGGTTVVSARFIAHAHRARVPVKVWTVDHPDDMHRLIAWGVDALISDRPDLAVDAVRRP